MSRADDRGGLAQVLQAGYQEAKDLRVARLDLVQEFISADIARVLIAKHCVAHPLAQADQGFHTASDVMDRPIPAAIMGPVLEFTRQGGARGYDEDGFIHGYKRWLNHVSIVAFGIRLHRFSPFIG